MFGFSHFFPLFSPFQTSSQSLSQSKERRGIRVRHSPFFRLLFSFFCMVMFYGEDFLSRLFMPLFPYLIVVSLFFSPFTIITIAVTVFDVIIINIVFTIYFQYILFLFSGSFLWIINLFSSSFLTRGSLFHLMNVTITSPFSLAISLPRKQMIWVCILCRKKQELLIKTGQWIHSSMASRLRQLEAEPPDDETDWYLLGRHEQTTVPSSMVSIF